MNRDSADEDKEPPHTCTERTACWRDTATDDPFTSARAAFYRRACGAPGGYFVLMPLERR